MTRRSETVLYLGDRTVFADAIAWALEAHGFTVVFARPDVLDGPVDARLAVVAFDPRREGRARCTVERAARVPLHVVAVGPLDPDAALAAGARSAVPWFAAISDLIGLLSAATDGKPAFEADSDGRFERLTPREAEVMALLLEGYPAQRIAARLVVSITTVRSHIQSILRKLEAPSQLVAVALAHETGWTGRATRITEYAGNGLTNSSKLMM